VCIRHLNAWQPAQVINPLYEKFGPTAEMVNHLDGIFAFVQYDETKVRGGHTVILHCHVLSLYGFCI
jgi:hypothetical protein